MRPERAPPEALPRAGALTPPRVVLYLPRRVRRAEYIDFSVPAVGDEDAAGMADTLDPPGIAREPATSRLEAAFRSRVGAADVLGLSSVTQSLRVGLQVLGVQPGDEVITTPMTFGACANVLEHLGARPVLADVEPDTLNLDPVAVETAVTSRTRAILAVHHAGHPVDLDPINDIARRRHLALIEDATHALPASYKGRLIGSGDNPVVFGFAAANHVAACQGGVLTGSAELIAAARVSARHRMSCEQAAMGLAELGKLEPQRQRRRRIVAEYQAAFGDLDALEIPVERLEVEHAWQVYTVRLRLGALRIGRDRFREELSARNIGTSVPLIPLHVHPFYRQNCGYLPDRFPVAHGAYERMLSLPLRAGLSDTDVGDVIAAVLDVANRFSR